MRETELTPLIEAVDALRKQVYASMSETKKLMREVDLGHLDVALGLLGRASLALFDAQHALEKREMALLEADEEAGADEH